MYRNWRRRVNEGGKRRNGSQHEGQGDEGQRRKDQCQRGFECCRDATTKLNDSRYATSLLVAEDDLTHGHVNASLTPSLNNVERQ